MNKKLKYNWDEIQSYYNEGNSWRDLKNKFGINSSAIFKAIKKGRFISRNDKSSTIKISLSKKPKRILSDETKKKISDSRIKYLKEHPDKVPYRLNHSSKMSYPEKVFQNALISTGITGWEYNFQNGIYSYDFAFEKQKIDIEIDGGTHLTDKVKQIDERRDEFSRQQGWIVVRFTAKEVKDDVIKCIEKVKKILMESKPQ